MTRPCTEESGSCSKRRYLYLNMNGWPQQAQTYASGVPATRVVDLVDLIRTEYDEMPGLCLTRAQVQRLWVLAPDACDHVLSAMIDAGYLRLTSGGYVRG